VKPQTARVLEYLRERGIDGVSPNEARLRVGCDRLAARIHEIRADGHTVRRIEEPNLGPGDHARYYLVEAPRQLDLFDSPVSAREVPPLGSRAHQAAERQPAAVRR
jgi:hypothetical protein